MKDTNPVTKHRFPINNEPKRTAHQYAALPPHDGPRNLNPLQSKKFMGHPAHHGTTQKVDQASV